MGRTGLHSPRQRKLRARQGRAVQAQRCDLMQGVCGSLVSQGAVTYPKLGGYWRWYWDQKKGGHECL